MPELSFEAKTAMVVVIVLMVVLIVVYHVLLERYQKRVAERSSGASPAKSRARR